MAEHQQSRSDERQATRAGGNGGNAQREAGEAQGRERTERGGQLTEKRGEGAQRMPARYLERDPFLMMERMSQELDQLWDGIFGRSFGFSPFRGLGLRAQPAAAALEQAWMPRVDVEQRDDSIVVHADLPGVRREDVHIECSDEGLVISGERHDERSSGERSRRVVERSYGSFFRQIPLPPGVDPEQVRATMQEGVLQVVVPLPATQRRRRVQIEERETTQAQEPGQKQGSRHKQESGHKQ